MNRFICSRLSETARSLLWLWENDPDGWARGGCAVAHAGAGVGVWTANSVYGLNAHVRVPRDEARRGHILSGQKIKLKWLDRRVLYRAMGTGKAKQHGGPIPFAISEWAMKSDVFAKAEPA